MTHTPGPWRARGPSAHNVNIVHVGADRPIGSVLLWVDERRDESEANARLIAAAPDLLAALRTLSDAVAQEGHPDGRSLLAAMIQASAAIAKAVVEVTR